MNAPWGLQSWTFKKYFLQKILTNFNLTQKKNSNFADTKRSKMSTNFLQISGADTFMRFYIKRRIEHGGFLQWIESPYCFEEDPPNEWIVVREAAIRFERANGREIEQTMAKLESIGNLDFRGFRMV